MSRRRAKLFPPLRRQKNGPPIGFLNANSQPIRKLCAKAAVVQAARVTAACLAFGDALGMSSSRRVLGQPNAIFSMTSAIETKGSTPFNLQVSIMEYLAAARSPPIFEPANSQFRRPMAGWTLHPAICAAMILGAPRVDLAGLVRLERLLIAAIKPTNCRSNITIVPDESNAVSNGTGSGVGSAVEPVIRQHQTASAGACRAKQDHFGAGSDPHAGGRPQRQELADDKR